ncbi:hypothetical protein TSUD_246800 [Trifolium subterraneum]|uniref:MADS-box domain-containing protein n=1 Tax=Trifolium subterraneum TaxID=3900 RepID=A0A2Z6P1V2_TRISU|nr:hypothetical protein TSUD_246800 [Trifolium subterraneum]
MLTKYEHQKNETTLKKFDVKDYFANKKNIAEVGILSVCKKITTNKYPTWSRCFNNLEREELKSFIDIVDFKIQACDQRINMLKNTQQSHQTNFMLNNVVSPQASQPDDTMKPLIDNINDMKDFTNLIEWDDLMPQNNVFSSHSSELDVMHSIPQMQPILAPLKSLDNISLPPVSSTKQLGEFVKLDDQEWATQLGEFLKLDELTDKSDQEWATQLMDLDNWAANKFEQDMFEWQDNSFLSEIEQEYSALDVFSQQRYGF